MKNKGRETALKESLKEDLTKEFEEYSFEDDPGSNNSGYYELQAGLFSRPNWGMIVLSFTIPPINEYVF